MADNTPKKMAQFIANLNNAGLMVMLASSFALFGVPVMWVAGVILSFYALEKPLTNALVVLLAAVLPSIIAFFMLEDTITAQIFGQMCVFLSILFALSYVLRTTRSWSVVLQAIGILGPCLIILLYIMYPGIDNWWLERLTSFFNTAEVEQATEELAAYAQYATGVQAVLLFFSALFNLFLARYWQACLYSKKRQSREEILGVQLSTLSIGLLVLLVVAAWFQLPWALDGVIIALIPAFMVGAAIVHLLCDHNIRKKNRLFYLILFYMMNVVVFPFVPMLIVILGFADYFLRLRERFGLLTTKR
jgi:hypothetical protein